VKSAILCLLEVPLTRPPLYFDRKFSFVLNSAKKPYNYNITALFPLVKEEYRNFFWEDLFINIRKREGEILSVCRDPATPADVRGRLFEEIMIARLVTEDSFPDDFKRIWNDADFTFNADIDAELRRPTKTSKLSNKKFPEGAYKDNCWTYLVPNVPNFPAVDIFIRLRKIVIAFQFHVSDHADVLPLLMNKTRDAGWTRQQVEKIILVYLSPNVETMLLLSEQSIGIFSLVLLQRIDQSSRLGSESLCQVTSSVDSEIREQQQNSQMLVVATQLTATITDITSRHRTRFSLRFQIGSARPQRQ